MTIRVLVADDQSMVRAGFRMLLGGEPDIEVVAEASTGREAIAKVARFDPTVVLMDIRMPELDGLEATRRILAAEGAPRVLILTTFALDEYIYDALNAGASGFVLKDDPPEQLIAAVRTVAAGEALRRVEQAGRTALTEMRGLLGAMRREGEPAELGPQPGLADVDALVAGIRRAGLAVEMRVEGTPAALPAAIDLSAYRIIQEGLTNTLKHADATRADVLIRYRTNEIEIEVRDDGRGASGDGPAGHGLVGMRERVKIYGGDMRAGAGDGGGFVLSTSFPLDGDPR